jgi:hypothetical protein
MNVYLHGIAGVAGSPWQCVVKAEFVNEGGGGDRSIGERTSRALIGSFSVIQTFP